MSQQLAMRRPQSLLIKNLMPGLTERGKIKIGEKGRTIQSRQGKEFQPPKKLDHFRVTTLSRGPDENFLIDEAVHKLHGDKPTRIPVRLLFDEIELNFQTRYTCFKGKTLWCSGDGETAMRLKGTGPEREEVPCPCIRQDPSYEGQNDKCKINGKLSVIIDGVDRVGGVWAFRTTSYNSVVGIMSSLALIQRLTGGRLAGLPLELTLQPKTAIVPTTGQAMQIWVVGLEYVGTVEKLREIAFEEAKKEAVHQHKIENIENTIRALITHDPLNLADPNEVKEIVEEFFPEQAGAVIDVEHTPPTKAVGPDSSPSAAPPQSNEAAKDAGEPEPAEAKNRRVRKNKMKVRSDYFGVEEVQSCGIDSDQLNWLQQNRMTDPERKAFIDKSVKEITGYDGITYLRHDEADQLIIATSKRYLGNRNGNGAAKEAAAHPQEMPPPESPSQESEEDSKASIPAADEEELIECKPKGGDRMYKSYCLNECSLRKKVGWCPSLGERAPRAEY